MILSVLKNHVNKQFNVATPPPPQTGPLSFSPLHLWVKLSTNSSVDRWTLLSSL